jgi:hypothetical protein
MMDSLTSFKPGVFYVDDLMDQFFYGYYSPAAIQNFLSYMWYSSSEKPSYVFLLGKGYMPDWYKLKGYSVSEMVPTIGNPSSDMLFVAGIDDKFSGYDKTLKVNIPIGRLSAHNNVEVQNYLDKLIEYDRPDTAMWHKNFVHIGGGEPAEQLNIRVRMIALGNLIKGPELGAKVSSFFVNNNDVVYEKFKTPVINAYNAGASFITYMGHGSANTFGVDIGTPNDLSNRGKYPVMYFNGCSVGNIGENVSLGEGYLETANKGAISFIAQSFRSYDAILLRQMNTFYNLLADNECTTIGQVYQKTINSVFGDYNIDQLTRGGAQQLIFQGDPSVKLKFRHKPDYAVFDSSMFVFPPFVIAQDDSFALAIAVSNLGSTDTLPLSITVRHTLPNGTETTYDTMHIDPVNYRDTAFFWIKRNHRNLQGKNIFNVTVDPENLVAETNESNNNAQIEFFFPGTGAQALYPMNYGIVGKDSAMLIAQSKNLLDNNSEIIYQIDTVPSFTSPAMLTTVPIKGSNMVSYAFPMKFDDSTVYYWRCRYNTDVDNGGEWDATRSFTYIKGSSDGWSQSQWPQFKEITGDSITIDTVKREIRYVSQLVLYHLTANPFTYAGMGVIAEGGSPLMGCYPGGDVAMIVLDRRTLKIESLSQWDVPCYGDLIKRYNNYNMRDTLEQHRFVDDVNNVKDGDYVMLVSRFARHDVSKWRSPVFDAFKKIGVTDIKTRLKDSMAFVIASIKGNTTGQLLINIDDPDKKTADVFVYDSFPTRKDPNAIDVVNFSDLAFASVIVEGPKTFVGNITSGLIGPATKWKMAYDHFIEDNSADEHTLSVIGVDTTGVEKVLMSGIKAGSVDISSVNAMQYPYLRLRATLSDSVKYTPSLLKDWTVIFDGIPEGTLATDGDFEFHADTIQQGDSLKIRIRFKNISGVDMKPLMVVTRIVDIRNNFKFADTLMLPKVPALGSVLIEDRIPTSNMEGQNILLLTANPDFAQPEVTLSNNYIKLPFTVFADMSNPVLEVTFNGHRLKDGELVSHHPDIRVTVTDENQKLWLNDTSAYTLRLRKDMDTMTRTVYFSDPDLKFIPSDGNNGNQAVIVFTPELSPGIYVFEASAKDRSGNVSGPEPYKITFVVSDNSAISKLYFYPNPLTYRSYFYYTIQGEVPSEMELQFFDVSGRKVASYNKSALGFVHTGDNEFSWDGKDANGAPLRNGIYIYRFTTKSEGKDVGRYPLPRDFKFSDGYGKILIVR